MMRANIPKLRRKLMRTRHQDGWVEERGRKVRRWYGHYYVYVKDAGGREVRQHRGIVLGEKAKLRKWEAENKLREEIKKATKGVPVGEGRTLAWFTQEKFVPMKAKSWAPSTRETNIYIIERHILPSLGATPLTELDKFDCQIFLNQVADKFSGTVVQHCRTLLKAILEEAVEGDFIGKNPARKLDLPETPEPEKAVLGKEEARDLLQSLEFRDRIILAIAAFCAMRPGEIFGLRWSSWHRDHFQIEGTAWRGTLRPGKAKTQQSKARVTIPDVLIPALELWREQNAAAPAEALIFPSESGTPMRPENWMRRRLKPHALTAGITTPVNFQVMRRTFATNAPEHGTNPKDVAAHLRHSNVGTTLNHYTQSIPANVRKLVNAVAEDVMAGGKLLTERIQ